MVLVAKRVAGRDILNSDDRRDVARVTSLDFFAFVGLDLDQPRDAFAFVRARIVNGVAFAQCAGVNAEENEFADKWIAAKSTREGAEVPVIVRRRSHRHAWAGSHSFAWRNV